MAGRAEKQGRNRAPEGVIVRLRPHAHMPTPTRPRAPMRARYFTQTILVYTHYFLWLLGIFLQFLV